MADTLPHMGFRSFFLPSRQAGMLEISERELSAVLGTLGNTPA